MLGLPTHSIYLVKEDGTRENVSMSDCSTKREFRLEVKDLLEYYSKSQDVSVYKKAQYVGSGDNILYECSIEDCKKES